MDSKQTDNSSSKKQIPDDWMPDAVVGKTKLPKQADGNTEEQLKKFLRAGVSGDSSATGKGSKENVVGTGTDSTIQPEESTDGADSLQTESSEPTDATRSTVTTSTKRTGGKQRKESLEEYRQLFLTVPKLEDRKPVFISREVRDRLDEIARKLGGRGRSVSGFIENLARHHLEIYRDDVELWKKL
ncbi:hypothetical protein FACS189431_6030 [Alphaproteobacteria bacterium]|nr:hypothetical protein FACS189431_6030 [Alphaproteobacteria bacterium]